MKMRTTTLLGLLGITSITTQLVAIEPAGGIRPDTSQVKPSGTNEQTLERRAIGTVTGTPVGSKKFDYITLVCEVTDANLTLFGGDNEEMRDRLGVAIGDQITFRYDIDYATPDTDASANAGFYHDTDGSVTITGDSGFVFETNGDLVFRLFDVSTNPGFDIYEFASDREVLSTGTASDAIDASSVSLSYDWDVTTLSPLLVDYIQSDDLSEFIGLQFNADDFEDPDDSPLGSMLVTFEISVLDDNGIWQDVSMNLRPVVVDTATKWVLPAVFY